MHIAKSMTIRTKLENQYTTNPSARINHRINAACPHSKCPFDICLRISQNLGKAQISVIFKRPMNQIFKFKRVFS